MVWMKRIGVGLLAGWAGLIGFMTPLPAAAQTDQGPQAVIDQAISSYAEEANEHLGDTLGGGGDRFTPLFTYLDQQDGPIDPNGFDGAMTRLYSNRYLRHTKQAGTFIWQTRVDDHCPDPTAPPTLATHNCDIPNPGTEMKQDMNALSFQGVQNAGVVSSAMSSPWFGLPSGIPGSTGGSYGQVPTKPEQRRYKYTGLEVLGYNFRITNYPGEWDHIKVLTSSRAVSNTGIDESVKLTTQTIIEGIIGQTQNGADENDQQTQVSDSDVRNIYDSMFSGWSKDYNPTTIGELLDSTDANIFNGHSWYRPYFGQTLYHARQLRAEEKSALFRKQLFELLSGTTPDDIAQITQIPEALKNLEHLPDPPTPGGPTCRTITTTEDGATQETLLPDPPGGPWTATQCHANTQGNVQAVWDAHGGQGQRVSEWVDANRAWFDQAQGAGLIHTGDGAPTNGACVFPLATLNESTFDQAYTSLVACYADKWQQERVRLANETITQQTQAYAQRWKEQAFDTSNLFTWFNAPDGSAVRRNFNAPWNTYVCTGQDGNDLRGPDRDLGYVFAYNPDGTPNPNCKPTRPTIQNGLFGNGYDQDPQTQLAIQDTRHVHYVDNTVANLPDISFAANRGVVRHKIINLLFGASIVLNRIVNTLLNVAYTPFGELLHLNEWVIQASERLRDSVYLPLIAIFGAFGVLVTMYHAYSARKTGAAVKSFAASFLWIGITFAMVLNPSLIIKAIDMPTVLERTLIAGATNMTAQYHNPVCSTATNGDGMIDFGDERSFTRMVGCNVWFIGVLNPYAQIQFGAPYRELDAARMLNTNTDLVGSPDVYLGGQHTESNWALYQAHTMASGTATTPDPSRPTGIVDPNIYRVVDMQAGPFNAKGRDNRFYTVWNGQRDHGQLFTAILTVGVNLTLLMVVGGLALLKIKLSILIIFMMLIAVALALGLAVPGRLYQGARNYMVGIAGAIIQKGAIGFLLAMEIYLLFMITTATDHVVGTAFLLIVVNLVLWAGNHRILNGIKGFLQQKGVPGLNQTYVPSGMHMRFSAPTQVGRAKQRVKQAVTPRRSVVPSLAINPKPPTRPTSQ